jgi:hypothetical protein
MELMLRGTLFRILIKRREMNEYTDGSRHWVPLMYFHKKHHTFKRYVEVSIECDEMSGDGCVTTVLALGRSYEHPLYNWDYRMARKEAFNKAMLQLRAFGLTNITKDERRMLWTVFFECCSI